MGGRHTAAIALLIAVSLTMISASAGRPLSVWMTLDHHVSEHQLSVEQISSSIDSIVSDWRDFRTMNDGHFESLMLVVHCTACVPENAEIYNKYETLKERLSYSSEEDLEFLFLRAYSPEVVNRLASEGLTHPELHFVDQDPNSSGSETDLTVAQRARNTVYISLLLQYEEYMEELEVPPYFFLWNPGMVLCRNALQQFGSLLADGVLSRKDTFGYIRLSDGVPGTLLHPSHVGELAEFALEVHSHMYFPSIVTRFFRWKSLSALTDPATRYGSEQFVSKLQYTQPSEATGETHCAYHENTRLYGGHLQNCWVLPNALSTSWDCDYLHNQAHIQYNREDVSGAVSPATKYLLDMAVLRTCTPLHVGTAAHVLPDEADGEVHLERAIHARAFVAATLYKDQPFSKTKLTYCERLTEISGAYNCFTEASGSVYHTGVESLDHRFALRMLRRVSERHANIDELLVILPFDDDSDVEVCVFPEDVVKWESSFSSGCLYSEFSEWTECAGKCGHPGSQSRFREVLRHSSHLGNKCDPSSLREVRACNVIDCTNPSASPTPEPHAWFEDEARPSLRPRDPSKRSQRLPHAGHKKEAFQPPPKMGFFEAHQNAHSSWGMIHLVALLGSLLVTSLVVKSMRSGPRYWSANETLYRWYLMERRMNRMKRLGLAVVIFVLVYIALFLFFTMLGAMMDASAAQVTTGAPATSSSHGEHTAVGARKLSMTYNPVLGSAGHTELNFNWTSTLFVVNDGPVEEMSTNGRFTYIFGSKHLTQFRDEFMMFLPEDEVTFLPDSTELRAAGDIVSRFRKYIPRDAFRFSVSVWLSFDSLECGDKWAVGLALYDEGMFSGKKVQELETMWFPASRSLRVVSGHQVQDTYVAPTVSVDEVHILTLKMDIGKRWATVLHNNVEIAGMEWNIDHLVERLTSHGEFLDIGRLAFRVHSFDTCLRDHTGLRAHSLQFQWS